MSFWFYLNKPADSVYKILFYKGNGTTYRTISEFFIYPDIWQSVIRLTNNESFDIGSDSNIIFQPYQWYYYTLTVDIYNNNLSYLITSYVNGKRDVSFIISNVISNEDPMVIGGSPYMLGITGYIGYIHVYNSILTYSMINCNYQYELYY